MMFLTISLSIDSLGETKRQKKLAIVGTDADIAFEPVSRDALQDTDVLLGGKGACVGLECLMRFLNSFDYN
jgi:hypothetical protein